MNKDYSTTPYELNDDDKNLQKMVESIKMNYAIKLLLKFGASKPERRTL
jgi:hypothetical protein